MIRLIVEDGGDRRGFKMGDGVLTVGAGAEAKLQLDAPDVAAIHAELEVRDGVALIRPRPGVLPPEVDGRPISAATELAHGQHVIIGGARLTVHYSDGVGPVRASAPGPARAAAAPGPDGAGPGGVGPGVVGPGVVRGRSSDRSRTRAAAGRARSKQRKQKGALTSLGVLAGAVVFLAGFAYFVGPKFMGNTAAEFEPVQHMGAARRLATRGEYDAALAELDAIPRETLTGAVAAEVEALREEIEGTVASRARDVHNVVGNDWWRENLDRFHKFFLRGTPEPGAVRFFLERLDEFEREWPDHPEQEWVDRMRERYAAVVDLKTPPTPADLDFHVRMMLEEDPKDWSGALAAIDAYVRSTTGADRRAGTDKRLEVLEQRQAWFDDKLQQARFDYEEGREGQAFAWLVRIVVYSGDAAMADQAADQLLRFEDLDSRLRGYRSKKLLEFTRIVEHPKVARYLEANPLS